MNSLTCVQTPVPVRPWGIFQERIIIPLHQHIGATRQMSEWLTVPPELIQAGKWQDLVPSNAEISMSKFITFCSVWSLSFLNAPIDLSYHWLCLFLCPCFCRRRCSPTPSWSSLCSASWGRSTFISSSRRPKTKRLWTSVRVLPK